MTTSALRFDVVEPGDVETHQPVEGKATPASARDGAGQGVIEMIPGSARRVMGKNRSDVHFSLFGEFNICNKYQLSAVLEECVGYGTITIDLAQTTFIDASLLGVFARLADRCRERNAAQVRIVNANGHLRKLFSICELDSVFDIADRPAHHGKPLRFASSL